MRDPGEGQPVNHAERISAVFVERHRPCLKPVDLGEVIAVRGRERRHVGGQRHGERAQPVRSRQSRRDVLVDARQSVGPQRHQTAHHAGLRPHIGDLVGGQA